MYTEIKKLLLNHKLGEALEKLTESASATDCWQIKSEIDNLKTTYGFMLQYAAQGVNDPERKDLYSQLIKTAFSINDKINLQTRLESNNSYLSRKYLSNKRVPMHSFQEIRIMLEGQQDELNITGILETDNKTDKIKDILKRQQLTEDELFNKIWLPVSWTNEEYKDAISIADSPIVSDNVKVLMASAACLSLMNILDPNKFRLLIHLYINCKNPAISLRAMAGIIICLHLMEDQFELSYPNLYDELALMKDIPDFYDDFYTTLLQLILSFETENIDKKMKDEIIPSIMNSQNMAEPVKDLSEMNIEDFTELNPQWRESIEKIKDQVKELESLRQEGADTNMYTFSQLKKYPFFYEPAHWFYLFGTEVPDIYEMQTNQINNFAPFIETLKKSTDMCNSDRFSLCLTFKNMPELPLEALNSGLSAQNQMLLDEQGVNSYKNKRRIESRHFIQELYRFCKLWGNEKDRIDIFNDDLTIWESEQIHNFLIEDNKLKTLADYLFAKDFISGAVELYSDTVKDTPTDFETYQKMGYGYIKLGHYEMAIKCMETANMLDPNNEWTLKNLALSYKKEKRYDDALGCLIEAETINPDNINISKQIGQLLIKQEKYEEAMKYLYKVEFYSEEKTSALRPIAWCHFMTGKYNEAIKVYNKIIEMPVNSADDWMNMGHILTVTNDIANGIKFYKKANELATAKRPFNEMFANDIDILLSKGVPEEIIYMIPDMVNI